MAVQDKAVTVFGAQTVLNNVALFPQADGSVIVVANGTTKDSLGATVQLTQAKLSLTGVPAVDNLVARALSELRKANGLEV